MAKKKRKTTTINLAVKTASGVKKYKVGTFKGKGDASIAASALNKNSPKNYKYTVK